MLGEREKKIKIEYWGLVEDDNILDERREKRRQFGEEAEEETKWGG